MTIDNLHTVAVIGAGDMGHGIAQLALMSGYDVILGDVYEEAVKKGVSRIESSLEKLIAKGRCSQKILDDARNGRLIWKTEIAKAVCNADFVIEAVPENIKIKKSVLEAVGDAAPRGSIIASNTSTMSISMLSEFVPGSERVIGTHYFNPAVLMKLVEVVRGKYTSDETVQFALDYVAKIGKTSVYAAKDTPGFLANRINIPSVLFHGYCMDRLGISAEDIDASLMQIGFKMGPMELLDYTGLDIMRDCMAYYHDNLSPDYELSSAIQSLISQEKYGKKTGEGFYLWTDGKRPNIHADAISGRYDPELFFMVEANEACKLVEDGVCSLKDCDLAMELGYNTPGPLRYISKYDPAEIAKRLNHLAEDSGKEVFRPCKLMLEGKYR